MGVFIDAHTWHYAHLPPPWHWPYGFVATLLTSSWHWFRNTNLLQPLARDCTQKLREQKKVRSNAADQIMNLKKWDVENVETEFDVALDLLLAVALPNRLVGSKTSRHKFFEYWSHDFSDRSSYLVFFKTLIWAGHTSPATKQTLIGGSTASSTAGHPGFSCRGPNTSFERPVRALQPS